MREILTRRTIGFRLILARRFNCLLLPPRVTERAMNGLHTSSCLTPLMETRGEHISMEMAPKSGESLVRFYKWHRKESGVALKAMTVII